MTNSAVGAHPAGVDTRASSACAVPSSPSSGGAGGCSESTSGASTQDTCGSVPAATSASNGVGNEGPNALAASAGWVWYRRKYGSTLSPKWPSALPCTFQLMPQAWSCSGIVVHDRVPKRCTRVVLVDRIRPPGVPAGSSHADIVYRRLGSVGPITEQWY